MVRNFGSRRVRPRRSSSIIETTAHVVLPHAIKVLKAKGYKLVTVAECLGVKPYQSVSAPKSVSLVLPLLDTSCTNTSPFRARGHVNHELSCCHSNNGPCHSNIGFELGQMQLLAS
jgi:hypothetical protein